MVTLSEIDSEKILRDLYRIYYRRERNREGYLVDSEEARMRYGNERVESLRRLLESPYFIPIILIQTLPVLTLFPLSYAVFCLSISFMADFFYSHTCHV